MSFNRFGVTGGRDFEDEKLVSEALSSIDIKTVMVNGMALGADTLAYDEWKRLGGIVDEYPANWEKYKRAAGPLRNREMLKSGLDFLLAFPGGRGTADMVQITEAAGIPVFFAVDMV